MDLQDTDSLIDAKQAKANLLALGAQWDAEKKAVRGLGTWRGKLVVGGAAGALVAGVLIASRAKRPMAPGTQHQRFPSVYPGWSYRARKRDVKKAVGGLSLAVLMKMAQPLLPHLAQFATKRYAQWRMAKEARGRQGNGVR